METDDFLPLSGLQHLAFCERQCALIHVEGVWVENRLTLEGRHFHDRVDEAGEGVRDDVRIVRGLQLRSERLKLTGKADVVEMRPEGPYPVEYKRGARKKWLHDEIQLCAQAVCLEEMMGVPVRLGALYYASSKRRREVALNETLRERTFESAERYHALIRRNETPPAVLLPKCTGCSLRAVCIPEATNGTRSGLRYVERLLSDEGDPA